MTMKQFLIFLLSFTIGICVVAFVATFVMILFGVDRDQAMVLGIFIGCTISSVVSLKALIAHDKKQRNG